MILNVPRGFSVASEDTAIGAVSYTHLYGHKYHGLTEPDESYHGVIYTKPVSYTHLLHGVHEDIYTSAFCLLLWECVGETWL